MCEDRVVTAVIVTHNSAAHIGPCLRSLGTLPTIVVDNNSTDGTTELVRRFSPTVKLVETGTNHGLSAGFNLGWRHVQTDWVLLLNPDIVVPAGAIEKLLAVSAGTDRLGVAAPRLVYEDGRAQHSARTFPTIWSGMARRTWLSRTRWGSRAVSRHLRMPESGEASQRDSDVDWVLGAAMLISRTLLKRLNGFNESYFLYCEDVDFCARAWRAGFRTRVYPEVTFVHHYQRSSRNLIDLRKRASRAHVVSLVRLAMSYPHLFLGLKDLRRRDTIGELTL